MYSLNSLLPDDIGVKRLIAVPDDAHARFSAIERGYRYRIHRRKDPFLEGRSHQLRPALDAEAMNEACAVLLGKQGFSSFCKAGSDARTMLCDVRLARWTEHANGYDFEIRADRYLRNKVRAIVGTCLLIGRGHRPPGHMAEVLAAQDRGVRGGQVGPCARALSGACGVSLHPRARMSGQARAFDRRLFVRVMAFVRPHRTLFRATFGLTVLLSAIGVVRPLLMGDMIDGYALTGDGSPKAVHWD